MDLVELDLVPVEQLATTHRNTLALEARFALPETSCVVRIKYIKNMSMISSANKYLLLTGTACYSPSQYSCSGTTLNPV